MDPSDFEGTLVLEKLAESGLIDDFFEAVDSDDFLKAKAIMKRARVSSQAIAVVLRKMHESDGKE